jgi:hypothetical protein
MNRAQIIETMARGMCGSHLVNETIPYRKLNDGTMVRVVDDHDYQDGTRPYWEWFHGHQATAALSALEAAGMMVVPLFANPKPNRRTDTGSKQHRKSQNE